MLITTGNSLEEMVDVIDENNQVVRTVTRRDAYAKSLSHRIVHVMVVKDNQVLIARRALSVRYLPGAYCTSAGGHVSAGEEVAAAAAREMDEELGLQGAMVQIGEFFFVHEFRVHVTVFLKRWLPGVDELRLNPQEVMSTEFMDVSEALQLCEADVHPQLKPCLEILDQALTGGF